MVDQVTYQVVHGGLRALAQEMKISVMRTAYSPIVASGGDMSAGIADMDGRVVAQGQDIPAQLGALPSSFDAMLDGWRGKLGPGDVLIGNDPYLCGSNHVNDVCLIMPAFAESGEPLGYICTRTHWMDIGGTTPGSFNARVSDMYAEGLRIPTILAYRNYEPVRDVWELIFSNVRGRTEREWDLRAGFAGCTTGERGLRRLASRYGVDALREIMSHAVADTESRVRARIAAVPDGRYSAVDWFEGDGWGDKPVRLEVAVEIDGSEVRMDWSGTDPQVRGGVNLPFSSTIGVGIYALKAALAPDIVPNAGMWAPLTVTAPEGCMVNPLPPAPNQASAAETIQRCADLLMQCLSAAVPDQVMAGTFASASVLMIEGRDPIAWRREILGRERTVFMDNSPGGMGGRISGDGVSGIKVHTGNARVPSIESVEFALPVRALRWERVPDSGGAGRERGGCGVAREWEILDDNVTLTLMSERARVPAFGLFGGHAGEPARFVVNDGAAGERSLPSKTPPTTVNTGDRILVQSAGGGGYGSPAERDPARVREDVLDGYITPEAAEREYGVAFGPDGEPDEAATRALREHAAPAAATVDRGTWQYGDISY
ncbi:MAG TPA: hydantoinase B/oxoprolinase family protein [Amycolatopsis sp.]|nr:hydantoinase B/oxoprolinase family protein [Amycolatopsis sp.]